MSVRIGETRLARVFNGAHIRKVRKFDRGYTLKYLANKCGCSEPAISRYERGERSMDVYTCKRILDALKCTPHDVLGKDDQEKMIAEFSEDAFVYADAEPTPGKIKKGLMHCCEAGCKHCPYEDDCHLSDGGSELAADALAYIRQLEAQVPKWISVADVLPERHGQMCVGLYTQHGAPKTQSFPYLFTWHAYGDNGYVDGPHFSDEGLDGLKVWYWMPLPQMPEESFND